MATTPQTTTMATKYKGTDPEPSPSSTTESDDNKNTNNSNNNNDNSNIAVTIIDDTYNEKMSWCRSGIGVVLSQKKRYFGGFSDM